MGLATGMAIGYVIGSSSKSNSCITPQITADNFNFWVHQAINSSGYGWWIAVGIFGVLAGLCAIGALIFLGDDDQEGAGGMGLLFLIFAACIGWTWVEAGGHSEWVQMQQQGYANSNPQQLMDLAKKSQSC